MESIAVDMPNVALEQPIAKHRLCATDAIVYRVRNGRGWATEFEWPDHLGAPTLEAH